MLRMGVIRPDLPLRGSRSFPAPWRFHFAGGEPAEVGEDELIDGLRAMDEESGRELLAVNVLAGAELPADLGPVFGDDVDVNAGRSGQEGDATTLGRIGSND
jgi:hypothetical protein